MKEEYTTEKKRGWILWISLFAVLLIGVGIFFYYKFLRQTRSELIEAVPVEAVFIYEINDNEAFLKDISSVLPYMNEAFAMDALPAFESVFHKLPNGDYDISASGHIMETGLSILFNTHIDQAAFKKLLRALSIDPANFQSFEQHKIYTYGTNYKSLKFSYTNHLLLVSDNLDLLKKAIIQHQHPKNLLANREFSKLYQIAEKNKKQNWLFINNAAYIDFIGTFFHESLVKSFKSRERLPEWSAFQIRVAQNEVFLSGYTVASAEDINTYKNKKATHALPIHSLPFLTSWYYQIEKEGLALCHFAVPGDSSITHKFMTIVQDTLRPSLLPLGDEMQSEEIRSTYPDGIYPLSDSIIKRNLQNIDVQDYKYMLTLNHQYIFAESKEALALYTNELHKNGPLADSRYYQFSAASIASSNLLEYTFYNPREGSSLSQHLSEKGKSSLIGQHLLIFSFSCNNITKDFAAINLYLNFGR